MKRIAVLILISSFFLVASEIRAQITLEVSTSFRWEATTGPLQGIIFPAMAEDSAKKYIIQETTFPKTFNAKVWRGDEIPWLGIVSVAVSNKLMIVNDESFRFDQATKARKEKIFIINNSDSKVYLRLGRDQVMLTPGGKSPMFEVYMGWYYLELSKNTTKGVIPFDVVVGVAHRQKMVQIE